MLGVGVARRTDAPRLTEELLRRHLPHMRVPEGADAREQVQLLHSGVVGRLRAVVSGQGDDGRRKVGWVSWLLFSDGWRTLRPHVDSGVSQVGVHHVEPSALGREVAGSSPGSRREHPGGPPRSPRGHPHGHPPVTTDRAAPCRP